MEINRHDYSRNEVMKYIGRLDQIGGTRHYELVDGPAKGTRAVDFDTGSGFRFTVLPDRGMDISRATYNGMNLVYHTPCGEISPTLVRPGGWDWLRAFFGGLLTTCGLTHLGPPCEDGREDLGLHGRHTFTPARRVCDLSDWHDDEYIMALTGLVEDSMMFGHQIQMRRSIMSRIGSASLAIHDAVTNVGHEPAPFCILYHINAGFPLLSGESNLHLTCEQTRYVNDEAETAGVDEALKFSEPQKEFAERVYIHDMLCDNEGFANVVLENPGLGDHGGIGLVVRFATETLPKMVQWQQFGLGAYALGIEPTNVEHCTRPELRDRNMLPMLEPGERVELAIEIGILDGRDEIDDYLDEIRSQ